jgi:hypothetical protein
VVPIPSGAIKANAEMLQILFKRPEVRDLVHIASDTRNGVTQREVRNLLDHCIITDSEVAFADLLETGFPICYGEQKRIEGKLCTAVPTLARAMRLNRKGMVELLIRKAGALSDLSRYSSMGLDYLTDALCRCASLSFPLAPSLLQSVGKKATPPEKLTAEQKRDWDIVDMVLSAGFNRTISSDGTNTLFQMFFPNPPSTFPRMHKEGDLLLVWKRFAAAGCDVTTVAKDAQSKLNRVCAQYGYVHLLDLSLKELGCHMEDKVSPGGGTISTSILSTALFSRQPAVALYLIKRGAKLMHPEWRAGEQILILALFYLQEDEAVAVITEMISREKKLLTLPCYKSPESSPLAQSVIVGAPKVLKLLLTLEGAEALLNETTHVKEFKGPMGEPMRFPFGSLLTPAQLACHFRSWECLELLLRTFPTSISVMKAEGKSKPVAELLNFAASGKADPTFVNGPPPPRTLVALVQARASEEEKELREKGLLASMSSSSAAQSNAPEDLSCKVLTAAEEKNTSIDPFRSLMITRSTVRDRPPRFDKSYLLPPAFSCLLGVSAMCL